MSRGIWLLVFLFAASSLPAQSSNTGSPDLSRFSIEQLVACFDSWRICGASDSHATGWLISDELAQRGDPHALLVRYFHEPRMLIRNGIVHIAYHFDSTEVTAFMRRALMAHRDLDDGEDLYWPANYLAKKCDRLGLDWLRNGRGRNQGSLQYETTLPLFGKCGYRPAIPFLVDKALHDSSGNVIDDALESLEALYPDHPKTLDRLDAIQAYYCERARKEGLKVKCMVQ